MLRALCCFRNGSQKRTSLLNCYIDQPARYARSYSIKPPTYKKSSNFLINAMNYVRDVEIYQAELAGSSSDADLVKKLLHKIGEQPELLFMLLNFHSQLASIGITATTSREFTMAQKLKYKVLYVSKLAHIHDVFWSQCRYLNISEREHELGFLPTQIGILDPVNFEDDVYNQLQEGNYNGVDFTHIDMLGVGKLK